MKQELLAQLANIAQQIPDATPSSEGAPGADGVNRILNLVSFAALAIALAALLAGAGMIGAGQMGTNAQWGSRGKTVVLGALIGAFIIGLGPQLVAFMFGLG